MEEMALRSETSFKERMKFYVQTVEWLQNLIDFSARFVFSWGFPPIISPMFSKNPGMYP